MTVLSQLRVHPSVRLVEFHGPEVTGAVRAMEERATIEQAPGRSDERPPRGASISCRSTAAFKDGRRVRVLAIVDDLSRECLALKVWHPMSDRCA